MSSVIGEEHEGSGGNGRSNHVIFFPPSNNDRLFSGGAEKTYTLLICGRGVNSSDVNLTQPLYYNYEIPTHVEPAKVKCEIHTKGYTRHARPFPSISTCSTSDCEGFFIPFLLYNACQHNEHI